MSFLAGSVNAGGFMACERFVTHVTGFATLSGIEIAHGRWGQALGILSVPVFFLGGVMIAAWLTVSDHGGKHEPQYGLTMSLVALCLFLAATAGSSHLFGVFGQNFYLQHDYVLVALLCLASGLQNAALTASSGATIRTTHLTGLTTDLGIGLIQMMDVRREKTKYQVHLRKNVLRLGTIGSFLAGGAVGAALFLKYKYIGFLMPASIALYAVYVARRIRRIDSRKIVKNLSMRG